MPLRSLEIAIKQFGLRQFAGDVWDEMFRTRSFVVAAALSFYFLLSLVPLLIVFSSLLGLLPIPNVFDQLLDLMATVVPPDAMALVQKIVVSVLSPPWPRRSSPTSTRSELNRRGLSCPGTGHASAGFV